MLGAGGFGIGSGLSLATAPVAAALPPPGVVNIAGLGLGAAPIIASSLPTAVPAPTLPYATSSPVTSSGCKPTITMIVHFAEYM